MTTGCFSKDAMAAIDKASNMNIIPVDGEKMATLMIQNKVGVEIKNTYSTYSIDLEYFEE